MHKFFYSFLLVWALVASFFALDSKRLNYIYSTYLEQKNIKIERDLKKDYALALKTLNTYYNADKRTKAVRKIKALENALEFKNRNDFLESYKRDLDYLISRDGEKSLELLKVIRLESSNLIAFANVRQNIPNEIKNTYLLKISISFKDILVPDEEYKISKIDEEILKKPEAEMLDKTLFLKKGGFANLELPCRSKSVSKGESQGVEYQVLSEGEKVRFTSNEDMLKDSVFKANCSKRFFNILTAKNKEYETLYQRLELVDGTLFKRKLTKQEKLYNDIERELGIKIESVN